MMFKSLLIAATLLAAPAFAETGYLNGDFQKEALDPVVQLERNCSAVILETKGDDTFAVTANHCVSGKKSGYVVKDIKEKAKLLKTEQYVYDVVRRDVTNDLAVLKLREKNLDWNGAIIDDTDPNEGELVYAIGYPLGLTRTVTDGYFGGYMSFTPSMGFDEFGNGRDVYRATPPITGGNSGGGLFVETIKGFRLVGISDAAFPMFPEASFYNTQESINEIVDAVLSTEEIKSKAREKN